MKKTLLGLFLGLSVMSMAKTNNNDKEYAADLTINANVIKLLTITQQTSMDFGDIVLGEAANSTTSGEMLVKGEDGYTVTVTVPETANIKNGENEVEVALKSDNNKASQTLTDGTLTQTISGAIAENATKSTGKYTGTVSISARYN